MFEFFEKWSEQFWWMKEFYTYKNDFVKEINWAKEWKKRHKLR